MDELDEGNIYMLRCSRKTTQTRLISIVSKPIKIVAAVIVIVVFVFG